MNGHASHRSLDIAHVLHSYTNLSLHPEVGPTVMTRGEGVYVFDETGQRYLDGMAGLFWVSLGYCNRRLADAADRQMRTLPFYHSFGHRSTEPAIELQEKLLRMAPVPMSKVFFGNSGSDANGTAVKIVWCYHNAIGRPAKKKIIARQQHYLD